MRARIERHIEQRTLLLSGVSHDLRTPLTRMKLELEMMEDPEAAALREDVAAMERIIDTFLDFARAEATDSLQEADITELVRDAVARAAPMDDVPVAGPEGLVLAVLPSGLARAVGNLVGNALRYGGRVAVEVGAGNNAIVISVEDDGPGIPEASRDDAMRPFGRLDAARTNTGGQCGPRPRHRPRHDARAWRHAAAGHLRDGRAQGRDRPAAIGAGDGSGLDRGAQPTRIRHTPPPDPRAPGVAFAVPPAGCDTLRSNGEAVER